jgi:[ribosomal protein S5]-alanine N-acetyltransferase
MKISSENFRVYLKTLGIEDAQAITEKVNDREITLNTLTIPFPYERQHALAFIEFATQKYSLREEYHLGIHLQNGELIGVCGLTNIDSVNMKAELGYWIGRDYWGKGYANEAMQLIMYFGFKNLKLNKIYAHVFGSNERSIKLLERLGFSQEGLLKEDVFHAGVGRFMDAFSYSILKKEFPSKLKVDVFDEP